MIAVINGLVALGFTWVFAWMFKPNIDSGLVWLLAILVGHFTYCVALIGFDLRTILNPEPVAGAAPTVHGECWEHGKWVWLGVGPVMCPRCEPIRAKDSHAE
jgi:hypothetical protein